MPVRIVVADDSAPFLAVVTETLSAAPGLEVVGSGTTGDDAAELVAAHGPDIVVMDVEMPGGGPALVERVLAISPHTRVLCLSGRDDEETVLAMLAAGASGYVAKGGLDDDLSTCVRRCADGMFFVIASSADGVRRRIAELMRD